MDIMSTDKVCGWCGELVLPEDRGPAVQTFHRCCLIRMVVGSYACLTAGAHRVGTCRGDDPSLSKRENAEKAYRYWDTHGRHMPTVIH